MPGLDLSGLNRQQLANALEAARQRNQHELSDRLELELRARRTRATGVTSWSVFHDERDRQEQPDAWWEDLRQEAELPAAPPPSKAPVILGVTAAVLVSAGLGWWLSRPEAPPTPRVETAALAEPEPEPPPAAVALAPSPPVVVAPAHRTVAAPPAPKRVAAPKPVVEVAKAPAPKPVIAAPAPKPVQIAKAEVVPPAPKSKPAPALSAEKLGSDATSAPAVSASCRAKPTPADRTICSHPELAAKHDAMVRAYDNAIAAGANALVVDRAQAEWRTTRNRISDPKRLARLYDEHTRELNAVARAAARQPRS